MKTYLSLAIAIMTFVAVFATTAQSQATSSQFMRAHIPFAFHVGSTELPAGEYTITVLNPSSDRKVLRIRSADGRVSAITNTLGLKANAPEQTKLVFHRYGGSYFFAQAQVAGESIKLAALKSNAETKEERMIASRGSRATVATVAGQ
jgi:hypothetical protein